MKRFLILAAWLSSAHSARADPPAALCAAAQEQVRAGKLLASEVATVFGKAKFAGAEENDCLYPLAALRYASADVLLVRAGPPDINSGYEALLSAYVIGRIGGSLMTVAKFPEFANLGAFVAVTNVWPVEIAGDDAMAIEGSSMSQGYSSTYLDFFAFRAGALVDLGPEPKVVLDADDEGAAKDASKAIVVVGSWFFDPSDKKALVVDYKIEAKGATRVERVVWRLQDHKFVLARGRVPPEVTQASGR